MRYPNGPTQARQGGAAVLVLLLAWACGSAPATTGTSSRATFHLSCDQVDFGGTVGSDSPPRVTNRMTIQRRLTQRSGELVALGVGSLTTVLRMRVTANGRADQACVSQSSGFQQFDQMVLDAAAELRFEPATRDGEPVPSWTLLPIAVVVRTP